MRRRATINKLRFPRSAPSCSYHCGLAAMQSCMATRRRDNVGFGLNRVQRQLLIAACFGTIVFGNPSTLAADQVQKAQAAETKAKALEQSAATGDSNAMPDSTEIITKTETQAVDPAGNQALDEAITCLARTIYWEAKGEEVASMEAVANVVMNRLAQKGFPKTICDVVTEGREQGACQFSWWCDGRTDDAEDEKSYAIAKEIARKALNNQLGDRTHGALYFHHGQATTNWSAEYIKTIKIGKFSFYKPPGDAAK
jgi:spore germination cell wall hydrolase CwlJ-like protein